MPGDARPAAPCHVGERPAIVLLGDSLTQYGFGPEGWAGYTSRWLLAAPSAAAVPHAKVLLTVIWLGANDAAPKSARSHVPLDEFSENLAALVAKARDRSDDVVVVSCPPVDDRAYFDKAFSKKHPDASFRDGRRDVFEAFDARPDGGRALLSDGLHLNEKGEALVFETLLRTVDDHCPRLRLSPCAETMSPANAGSAAPTPRTGAADLRRSGSGDGSFSEYGSSGDFGRDYNDSRDFSRDFSRD
ncbi:hypothetical protein JL721_11599 [Aureococcus anophagefferens]|nr:hypothetical protein JL721_11599 [Aureococcus anophagefferens]